VCRGLFKTRTNRAKSSDWETSLLPYLREEDVITPAFPRRKQSKPRGNSPKRRFSKICLAAKKGGRKSQWREAVTIEVWGGQALEKNGWRGWYFATRGGNVLGGEGQPRAFDPRETPVGGGWGGGGFGVGGIKQPSPLTCEQP